MHEALLLTVYPWVMTDTNLAFICSSCEKIATHPRTTNLAFILRKDRGMGERFISSFQGRLTIPLLFGGKYPDRSLAPSTSAPDDSETMKTLSIPLAIFFSIIDVGLANDTTLLRHRREEENLCFLYTEEDAEGICNAYYQQGCVENPTKDSCAKLAENFKKITDQSIPGSIPCETSLLSCRCIEEFDNFYDILSQLDEDSCTFDFGLAIDPPFFSLKVDQFGSETCSATVSAIRTQSLTFIGFCGTFIDQLNNFGPFPPLFPAELAACEEVLQCYSDYFGLEECISDGDGSC